MLVNQLVANLSDSIPDEFGFCIDHACVRDPFTAESTPSPEPNLTRKRLIARNDESDARAPLAVNTRFSRLRAAREIRHSVQVFLAAPARPAPHAGARRRGGAA
jgi:hypothetical protein